MVRRREMMKMKDADRYIWLIANMSLVEDEAKRWRPAKDKPLLRHLQDFVDQELTKTTSDFIARQRAMLNDA